MFFFVNYLILLVFLRVYVLTKEQLNRKISKTHRFNDNNENNKIYSRLTAFSINETKIHYHKYRIEKSSIF